MMCEGGCSGMRGVRVRLTERDIERALREAHGIVSVAAQLLGINRCTLYKHINKSPALQDTLADCREEIIDIAESSLIEAAREGQPWACRLILTTLGRSRGYTEKPPLERLSIPAPIDVNIPDETICALLLGVDEKQLHDWLQTIPGRTPLPRDTPSQRGGGNQSTLPSSVQSLMNG